MLAEKALTHYGSEAAVYANFEIDQLIEMKAAEDPGDGNSSQIKADDNNSECKNVVTENGDRIPENRIERYFV